MQVSFEDSVFEHSSWVVGCWDKSSEVVGYTEEVWGISVVISEVKCSDLIKLKFEALKILIKNQLQKFKTLRKLRANS